MQEPNERQLSRGQLLSKWQVESMRLEHGGTPKDYDEDSVELFYPHIMDEVPYHEYGSIVKRYIQETGPKRSLFPGSFTIQARLADYFVPPSVKKKLLPELLAKIPTKETLAELAKQVYPKIGNEVAAALEKGGEKELKAVAMKLQVLEDIHSDPKQQRLLHGIHVYSAIRNDADLASRLGSEEPEKAIEALHELYADRVAHSASDILTDEGRLKVLATIHSKKMEKAGVASPPGLSADYKAMEAEYRQRAFPKNERVVVEETYKDHLVELKASLSKAIKAGDQAEADWLSAELKKAKQAHTEITARLSAYNKGPHKKLFQQMLQELRGGNPETDKAMDDVVDLFDKIRVKGTGETTLEMRPQPSVLDAFAGYFSHDCTKGRYTLFSHPNAHNLRVYNKDTGKQVGNVYLLEGAGPGGRRILHIDAIQIPTKADQKHLTRELVDELWRQAHRLGFKALTANVETHYVSNHATVQKGFEANFRDSLPTEVKFPYGLHGFQSRDGFHRILHEE